MPYFDWRIPSEKQDDSNGDEETENETIYILQFKLMVPSSFHVRVERDTFIYCDMNKNKLLFNSSHFLSWYSLWLLLSQMLSDMDF